MLIARLQPLLVRAREAIEANEALNGRLRDSIVQLDEGAAGDTVGARRTLDRLNREEAQLETADGEPAQRSAALRAFREEHRAEREELRSTLERDDDADYHRARRHAINEKIGALIGAQLDGVAQYETLLREIVAECLASIDDTRRAYGAAVSAASAALDMLAKLAPVPTFADGTTANVARRLRGVAPIANPARDPGVEAHAREAMAGALGDLSARGFRYLVSRPANVGESARGERMRRNVQ
ncbi:hypothetical protein VSR82_21755 [Burkholderia sp. JPY481]